MVPGNGDVETPALRPQLSATAEGQSSTAGLRSGAAETYLALGKDSFMTTLGLVRRMKKGGRLELTALGRHST